MSTNKTQNYNLNQWVKSDPVLMSEFNADNAKIDAALAGLEGGKASTMAFTYLQNSVNSRFTDLQSTISGQNTALELRNCRFEIGSYTGDGTYGPSNANSLSFSQRPVFLHVVSDNSGTTLDLIAGQDSAFVSTSSSSNSTLIVTWGSRSVSWYAHNPSSTTAAPGHQMNASGTYHYFALLEIE